MISHIQELEDHINDLQSGFDMQMAAAVGEADHGHVQDLEFKIEKLTQELEVERMKNRQNEEVDQLITFRANRDNLYDLEVKLIEDAEKLKLEKFALEKKSQQLDEERVTVQQYKSDCEKEFEGLKQIIEELSGKEFSEFAECLSGRSSTDQSGPLSEITSSV